MKLVLLFAMLLMLDACQNPSRIQGAPDWPPAHRKPIDDMPNFVLLDTGRPAASRPNASPAIAITMSKTGRWK